MTQGPPGAGRHMMRARHPNYRPLPSLPPELRRTTVPEQVRAWMARATGAIVVGARRLAGASSTAVHAIAFSDGRRAVLRRYAWPGFLEDEPVAPRREVEGLRFASAAGLPVPTVLAADLTGLDVGDGVPVVLMSLVRGTAVAVPDLARLAEAAVAVHGTDASGFPHRYFPWDAGTTSAPPAGAAWPALWEVAREVWRDERPLFQVCFIHRDFHPGNVLWSRRRLSGVVDWANCCAGPAGCDVATCAGNLIDLGGVDAAMRFVTAYEATSGMPYHPYWEVASVLEGGISEGGPLAVATGEHRLARALASMGRLPRRR